MDTQFSSAVTFLICLCSLFPKLFPSCSFLKLATPSAALPQLLTWQYSSLENRSNQTWIPLCPQHLNHQTNPSPYLSVLCLLFTSLNERPTPTPGLKILPALILNIPFSLFCLSISLSDWQSHHPHGLLAPGFKKPFLNPTYISSYWSISLLPSHWQMWYISKRRE